jgi:endonuclease YncB( thermonuclease family)
MNGPMNGPTSGPRSHGVMPRRWRYWIGCAAVSMLGTVTPGTVSAAAVPREAPQCVVIGADDAATWRLTCGGAARTLRLAAVRAPRPGTRLEGGETYGTRARDLVRGWFVGRRVEVDGGTAWLAGEDVRVGLLALGLVECTASPGAEGEGCRRAEREGRNARRGMWSFAAWRAHESSAGDPLTLRSPTLPAPEPLGSVAARLSRRTPEQRRAAIDAAMAELAALPPVEEEKKPSRSGSPQR